MMGYLFLPYPPHGKPKGLTFLEGLFQAAWRPIDIDGDPRLIVPTPLFVRKTVRATVPPDKRSLKGGRRK